MFEKKNMQFIPLTTVFIQGFTNNRVCVLPLIKNECNSPIPPTTNSPKKLSVSVNP